MICLRVTGSGIAAFCRLNHLTVNETSPGKSCCKIKERMIEGSPPACECALLIKEWECRWVWFDCCDRKVQGKWCFGQNNKDGNAPLGSI